MQGYNETFARIYNARWRGFASTVAPLIRGFYEQTETGAHVRTLLDLSPAMLDHARENVRDAVASGQARFVQGDAAAFSFDERFGLVVSTYDALNHLPDLPALRGAFRSVYSVLEPGGWFVFDLNTRLGLRRWAGASYQEDETVALFNRGVLIEDLDRAYTSLGGCRIPARALRQNPLAGEPAGIARRGGAGLRRSGLVKV